MQDPTSTALAVPDSPQPLRLGALVAGYLAGYQPATRRSYTTDLKDWFRWCDTNGLPPLDVQRAHMDFYLRQLEELGRSPATISRRITSVGGFYRWCHEEDVLPTQPARTGEAPPGP